MPIRKTSLAQLVADGLGEDFDRELERVLENVRDPNTDSKQERKIVIEICIKPLDESRTNVVLSERVTAKVAGPRKHQTAAMLDDAGLYTNAGADPLQRDAFDADGDEDVTPIDSKTATAGGTE